MTRADAEAKYADIPRYIEQTVRDVIALHFSQHYNVNGKPVPLKDNISDVQITFHPSVLPLAMQQLPWPQEVDGVPVTYAEAPLRGQAFGISVMAHWVRSERRRGSRGLLLRRL